MRMDASLTCLDAVGYRCTSLRMDSRRGLNVVAVIGIGLLDASEARERSKSVRDRRA